MNRHRARIPQKQRVFLGCEGASEQSYGKLLINLLRDAHLPIHLDVVPLNPGAGDPIALMARAEKEIDHRERSRGTFVRKAMLLDDDRVAGDPAKRLAVERAASRLQLALIWQAPCHEAVLLRHLDGCSARRPETTDLAKDALLKEWPDYRKGMSATELHKRIKLEAVRRASAVEPQLAAFLGSIRLFG